MDVEEARQNLQKAIVDFAQADGQDVEGIYLLNHFIVVAHWEPLDGSRAWWYGLAQHADKVPAHISMGLLELGHDIVLNGDGDD